MKVERPISVTSNQRSSQTHSYAPSLTNTMSEPPQTSLPPPSNYDADLAFDREELLKPSHRTSHGPKVWAVKALKLKLSALEATVAVKGGVFTYDDFEV